VKINVEKKVYQTEIDKEVSQLRSMIE